MRSILKAGIISFAFGLMFVATDVVNAQTMRQEARRERREEIREARREFRRDVRRGANRREARREMREEVRDARRDFRRNVRRGNTGWYYYSNGRRVVYPYRTYHYRNGRFIRRF